LTVFKNGIFLVLLYFGIFVKLASVVWVKCRVGRAIANRISAKLNPPTTHKHQVFILICYVNIGMLLMRQSISRAVGYSSPNNTQDIAIIINLLKQRQESGYYGKKMISMKVPNISDKDVEKKIVDVISEFQRQIQGVTPDGVVSPNGTTIYFMGGVRTGDKQIIVDLNAQNLYAFKGGTQVYEFWCTTGDNKHITAMKPTLSHVSRKHKKYRSRKYNAQMDYAMFFSKDGKAIHQSNAVSITSALKYLGIDYFGSHGCVRLNESNASTLFKWTRIGTPVFIDVA